MEKNIKKSFIVLGLTSLMATAYSSNPTTQRHPDPYLLERINRCVNALEEISQKKNKNSFDEMMAQACEKTLTKKTSNLEDKSLLAKIRQARANYSHNN